MAFIQPNDVQPGDWAHHRAGSTPHKVTRTTPEVVWTETLGQDAAGLKRHYTFTRDEA